jgi:hypothetical protein
MIEFVSKQKPYIFACLLLIAIAFSITIYATSVVTKPIGADYYFHLDMATLISKGDVAGAWNYSLSHNLFPYGFMLFHFALSLTALSGNPYFWALIAEAILMPTTFTLTIYLMIKKASPKAAFITGLCLLGSLAFIDGTLQFRPESIDLLFYPLMLFAVLSVKKKSFISMAVITIYSHSLAALSSILGITLKLFKDNKYQWRKYLLIGTATIIPVLAVSAYYVQGAFKMWFTLAGANNSNPQQTLFWTQPLAFIPFYSGLTLIGFAFLLKRHKSYFESLLSWGILASAIMIPFWADRWLQYITIPASCLIGLGLKDTSTKKLAVIMPILLAVSFLYVIYWWMISINHAWWQPGM